VTDSRTSQPPASGSARDRAGAGHPPRTAPAEALAAMRQAAPLVHCITNYVAMNVAANALLAAGASPAMIHAAEEAADFARVAAALTVNIGTLSTPWLAGMEAAARASAEAGRPWVLDPVAHFATPFRQQAAARLMALHPTIVRGNASEILALSGGQAGGRGADSGDAVEDAEAAARALARASGAVLVVTGPQHYATDGQAAFRVSGGDPLMPKVTALGCALTALTGAYAAAVSDPLSAALGALGHFAAAGEAAGQGAAGPGSFAPRFLDALAATGPEGLDARVRPA